MRTATRTFTIVQFSTAIALALVLGLALVQAGGAQKYAKGFNQSKSIASVGEMCELGGGTLSVKDSPFEGVKISKCTGGDMDGYSCGHGQKTVNCSYQISSQSDGSIVVDQQVEVSQGDQSGPGQAIDTTGQIVVLQPLEPKTPAP
jgi:hypothetical protein